MVTIIKKFDSLNGQEKSSFGFLEKSGCTYGCDACLSLNKYTGCCLYNPYRNIVFSKHLSKTLLKS